MQCKDRIRAERGFHKSNHPGAFLELICELGEELAFIPVCRLTWAMSLSKYFNEVYLKLWRSNHFFERHRRLLWNNWHLNVLSTAQCMSSYLIKTYWKSVEHQQHTKVRPGSSTARVNHVIFWFQQKLSLVFAKTQIWVNIFQPEDFFDIVFHQLQNVQLVYGS